jgi:hypothetical protein
MYTKIDGSIEARSMSVTGYGYSIAAAHPLLTMIEQRISSTNRDAALVAHRNMVAAIEAELVKLGLDAHVVDVFSFAESVSMEYSKKLTRDRMTAIVDGLVASTQPSKDPE